MNQTIQIINRILPIIILLIIGKWIQQRKLVEEQSVADFKKIVVNLALPAVLFNSFFRVELQVSYIWFLPLIFGYCLMLYLLGTFLHRYFKVKGEYFPFLTTGFEYGMIGVSLFAAAYGLEQLGSFAIIDFGQEMFIWFLYVSLLMQKREEKSEPKQLLKMFATSPVILAIFAGILLNLTGLPGILEDIPAAGGILAAVDMVSSLTVPLILIVVGYGIQVDTEELAYSARVILLRLAVNVPAALLINRFVVGGLMGLGAGFQAAVFTLLILPPPFILTLYMKPSLKDELHRVANTLTLHTIATIIVFIIYYAFNPMI